MDHGDICLFLFFLQVIVNTNRMLERSGRDGGADLECQQVLEEAKPRKQKPAKEETCRVP